MSTDPVQKAMLDLMDVVSDDIIYAEALANELVQGAKALSGRPGSESIRDTALHWRVKSIKLRMQLAALHEEYATRFPFKM
ncbi:hypothetical protein LOK46_24020 [Methylobacterium sp. NMS14P]|uniref:hypothetical protein n=1 Tax=Methylobacterium sp. NMS14P TaxID=2894310 RepID=UPI002358D34A|nr:hypothetical protein [Methylobacterium sp. NMS14P]WCS24177.1 hypothetical protein LOK46_24020 [Methylobacterium sp. NMS14P]